VTGELARIIEHTEERGVGQRLAVRGAAMPGAHRHPQQDERFEVLEGVLGYRRAEERGELRAGESADVPAGVVHDWWNAGDGTLRARVVMTPPGSFVAMIAAVWGLAALGRTTSKGKPRLLDAALLGEAFGEELVFERPPLAVQRALVATVAPLARRLGRSVTTDDVVRAAVVRTNERGYTGAN
jgi:quercetin dioxygenase-like cupin family protein